MKNLILTFLLVFAGLCFEEADASLMLKIDALTETNLTFTVSGTFDEDTIGDAPGCLALKNNWSAKPGVHTEFMNSNPVITSDTVLFNGSHLAPTVYNTLNQFSDSVFWIQTGGSAGLFTAGTSVSGSMTLTGSFNPAAATTLQLASGWYNATQDWARLEAQAVPEPSVIPLLFLGGALFAIRRVVMR